jgi:hypothetical protein
LCITLVHLKSRGGQRTPRSRPRRLPREGEVQVPPIGAPDELRLRQHVQHLTRLLDAPIGPVQPHTMATIGAARTIRCPAANRARVVSRAATLPRQHLRGVRRPGRIRREHGMPTSVVWAMQLVALAARAAASMWLRSAQRIVFPTGEA